MSTGTSTTVQWCGDIKQINLHANKIKTWEPFLEKGYVIVFCDKATYFLI